MAIGGLEELLAKKGQQVSSGSPLCGTTTGQFLILSHPQDLSAHEYVAGLPTSIQFGPRSRGQKKIHPQQSQVWDQLLMEKNLGSF